MLNNTQKFMLISLGVLVCVGTGLYVILTQLQNGWIKYEGIVTDNSVGYEQSQDGVTGGKDVSIGVPTTPSDEGGANTPDQQKLIKTGQVSMTVNDFDKTIGDIKEIVSANKGLIVTLYDAGELQKRNATIKVKVPAKDFDKVVELVKKLGVTVVSSNENSTDITMTYLDLQARLKTNKELEKSYIQILNKASKVSEILEIQRELNTVRQQIEYIDSQIKYYDSQIDMSVINITLTLNSEALDVVDDTWKPFGVFKEALQALVSTLRAFVSVLIWLVVFSPFVLIPFGIVKLVSRKNKK